MNTNLKKSRELIVQALLDKWLPRLGLDRWIINLRVMDTVDPDDNFTEACITDDLKYHEATIEIWLPFWQNNSDHQEKNIIHEITHLLLCRIHPYMAPIGDDALEEVVQGVAMLFYKAYK